MKTIYFLTGLVSLLLFNPLQLNADTFIYEISNPYGSTTTPSGGLPWGIITFQDTASDHVQLSISAPASLGTQFISQLNFNFDPNQLSLLNALSITNISGVAPVSISPPSENAYNAGPSQQYDFQIDFQTASSPDRLSGGASSYFDITGTGLLASMFNFTNEQGSGPFITAVHIQNVPSGDGSVWASNGDGVAVPEPSTYLILASFLGLVTWFKYNKRVKATKAV